MTHPPLNRVYQEPHRPWSPSLTDSLNGKRPRDDGLVPLVIPVSVPVRRHDPSASDRDDATLASCWSSRLANPLEPGRDDHKPSVIVARRRSLRNSASESPDQVCLSSSCFCFFFLLIFDKKPCYMAHVTVIFRSFLESQVRMEQL